MANLIRNFIILLALFSVSPWVSTASAATYYVGKFGSTGNPGNDSNDCTAVQNPATPKLTIQDAIDDCFTSAPGSGANHVIEVFAGTYTERVDPPNGFPRGSSWNAPFTIRAKAGDTVIIQSTTEYNFAIYDTSDIDAPWYLIVQGFTFDGTNGAGVAAFVSHLRMIGNEFINTNGCGTLIGGRLGFEFINNKMHGGQFGTQESCGLGGGGSYGYPVYHSGNGALFEGNELYDFPTFGFHLYRSIGCPTDMIVRNNKLHDFGWAKDCPVSGDPRCAGRGPDGRGVAILVCGFNHEVYNNITWNGTVGIHGYTQTGKEIYNNTVFNMSVGGILSDHGGNIVRNNIVYNPQAPTDGDIHSLQEPDTTIYSNNLCARPGTGCSIIGDPLFADPGNGDFRLCVGSGNPHPSCGTTPSPAIDAGTTLASVTTDFFGTSRPQPIGGAYDIGAIESGETPTEPPPPTSNPINVVKMSFDEGTGQPQDVSGNANHGTLGTGVTWTTVGCKYNGCLSFAGTGGVTIADSASIDTITHGFTLSAWVKPTSVTNNSVAIVRNPNSKFFLFSSLDGVCGDNRPLGGHGQGGGVFACQASSLQPGIWSHLSVTYNGSQVIFYLNGASVATVASTVVLDPTDGTLQIGTSGFNEHFIGLIDEIFVDNYALSQAEIQTRMATAINDPGPNPPVAGAYGRTGANAVRKMGAGAVAKSQGVIPE